jgi:hypothetical protein
MDLYLHSLTYLHGVVLKHSSNITFTIIIFIFTSVTS